MKWIILHKLKDYNFPSGLYLAANVRGDYTIIERFANTWQPYAYGSDDFEFYKVCKIED